MNIHPMFKDMPNSRRFWMLMFIFMLCLGVFSLLSSLILLAYSNVNSAEGLDHLFDDPSPQTILGLKIAQLISAVGSFIVPAHIFALLSSGNYNRYLRLNTKPLYASFVIAAMIMICAMPLINWMAVFNISFFEKYGINYLMPRLGEWIKNSERQAEKLTEIFLKMEKHFIR